MSDWKSLDHLGPIADEMLGGLHADEAMRLAIRRRAQGEERHARSAAPRRVAPVVRFAALALLSGTSAQIEEHIDRVAGAGNYANSPYVISRDEMSEIYAKLLGM